MATNMTNDGTQTLEQLEGNPWGDPPADASRLITTVHGLRRKPVGQLDAEDLRVLLSQQVGIDALVPYALDVLDDNPLAEGDFYPGDLLKAVLELPAQYWQQHPDHEKRITQVVSVVASMDLDAHYAPADVIHAAIERYRSR
ncbi:contact-dependent growth inhibition system immunity protein [Amycolatopsis sp. NPDC051716]|uniref:contact-dependent growth inhibition system immunity protein n=1 Tax=Amycolatopsis sp. NPDC051716 TaxID=3155804 RepID=UPI003440F987